MNPWNRIIFAPIDPNFSIPENNEIRFLLASKDGMRVVYGKEYLVLKQGDFLIINPRTDVVIPTSERDKGFFIKIFVSGIELKDLTQQRSLPSMIEGCSAIEYSQQDGALKACLMKLVNLKINRKHVPNAKVLKLFYQIITIITENYVIKGNDFQFKEELGSKEKRAYDLRDFIDINYKSNLTLADLASHFYLSTAYTSHLFKEVFKISFHQYVTKLKLQSAIDDIVNTNNTMTDIALQNGFPNIGSFNSAFKHKHQMTPTQFRKEKRHAVENGKSQVINETLRPQMTHLVSADKTKKQVHEQHLNWSEMTQNGVDTGEFNKNWGQVINLGSAESLLLGTMAQQIQKVQQDIGFEYGRLWGLFTDEMLMVNSNSEASYSFTQIDSVLELLLKNQLTPFLELGNKPLKVNANSAERIKVRNHYQFIENQQYQIVDFLSAFIRHCIAKWGKSEVAKWQFELWYPSSTVIKSELQTSESKRNIQDYLTRFDLIKSCIKSLLPTAKVGGCGLSVDIDFQSISIILKEWKKHRLPDFFSIYLYAQNMILDDENLEVKNSLSNDPHLMSKMIRNVKVQLANEEMTDIPIYVTEWNISISDRNFIHDSLFQSAYVIKNIVNCYNQVDVLAYWQLSDIPGASNDVNGIFHGGIGLLSKDNIAKPAYDALVLLDKARGKVLYYDDDILITNRGQDKVSILITNYSHFNGIYYLNKENNVDPSRINDIFENTADRVGKIVFDEFSSGNYLIKSWEISPNEGNAFKQWLSWGMPSSLGNEEIEYLRLKSGPKLSIKNITVKEHSLGLPYQLHLNSTLLLELYREP